MTSAFTPSSSTRGLSRMRKDGTLITRIAAAAGAAMLAAAIAADAAAAGPPATADAFAGKMNQVAGAALSRLAGDRSGSSIVLSPYSLGSALHLLLMGAARGSEAERCLQDKLLPAGVAPGEQDPALKALAERVIGAGGEGLRITTASAAFLPLSAQPSPLFVSRAKAAYDAPITVLDFKSGGALERINAWSREATRGLVPHILDALDIEARFVLTSAVHFHGAWEAAFDRKRTSKAPFTRADGSQRRVAMMESLVLAEHAEIGGLQAVWLPYRDRDVAMLVIVPGPDGAPAAVAGTLKSTPLDALAAAAEQQVRRARVQVRLPRFRAESSLDLTEALTHEIAPALAPESDYGLVNTAASGALQVFHRAVIEVEETGTVAAAASAVTTDRSLAVPTVISVDRPFAFAIVHRPTRAILVAGYIGDPGDGAPEAD